MYEFLFKVMHKISAKRKVFIQLLILNHCSVPGMNDSVTYREINRKGRHLRVQGNEL